MMLRRVALFLIPFALATAAVTRVEISSRVDLPIDNYERLSGKIYFAVDPKLPSNQIITDIGLAPTTTRDSLSSPPTSRFYTRRPIAMEPLWSRFRIVA